MSTDGLTVRRKIASDTDHTVALVKLRRFCKERQFSEADAARALTATSELLRNVLKYATRGDLEFDAVEDGVDQGVRIRITDDGPGIENIDDALRPGFSTSGTLGLGLSGAKKLVDRFDISSDREHGTLVVLHVWKRHKRHCVNRG